MNGGVDCVSRLGILTNLKMHQCASPGTEGTHSALEKIAGMPRNCDVGKQLDCVPLKPNYIIR